MLAKKYTVFLELKRAVRKKGVIATFTCPVRTASHEKRLQTNHIEHLFKQEIRNVAIAKVLYVLMMSEIIFFPGNENNPLKRL